MRILLIEDEPEMAGLIAADVEDAGFVVDRGRCSSDALEAVEQSSYDLILLDRRLPDGDGLSLLPAIRKTRPGIRVIMLTALDAMNEKVSGLNSGADDYLTKPYIKDELVSRIRACLRRPGCAAQPPAVIGALSFDLASSQVSVRGRPLTLHRRELTLLEALIRRANRVATRETLLEEVYGLQAEVQPSALDTLVWRLRSNLKAVEAGVTIHMVRGIGYTLKKEHK